jgi:putative hydrolase of the HAD superfamily
MNQKRAVLFDVDGVLIHSMFHPDPARCRRWDQHMKEDMGVEPQDFVGFFKERFGPVIRGQKSLISELEGFLPTIGYTGSPMTFLSYWLKNDTHLNLALLQAIKTLARSPDTEIYLATNQEHLRAFYLWHNLGLSHIFSDMFYAARLGEAKPDKAYFSTVDAALGPQSQPPLFFDDGHKNIEAANAHGWEAVLFDELADFTSHPYIAARLKP